MEMEKGVYHLGEFPLFSMVVVFVFELYMNTFKIIHFFPLTPMNEISISLSPVNFETSDTKIKYSFRCSELFFIATDFSSEWHIC